MSKKEYTISFAVDDSTARILEILQNEHPHEEHCVRRLLELIATENFVDQQQDVQEFFNEKLNDDLCNVKPIPAALFLVADESAPQDIGDYFSDEGLENKIEIVLTFENQDLPCLR